MRSFPRQYFSSSRFVSSEHLRRDSPDCCALYAVNAVRAGLYGPRLGLRRLNILLQIDKDSAKPLARVNLGKEREPAYAVDDIADMLFLQTAPGWWDIGWGQEKWRKRESEAEMHGIPSEVCFRS